MDPAAERQRHGVGIVDTIGADGGGGWRQRVAVSGNSAFDRSAMNAVERAGRFPEVVKLEDRIFEANFRRFS